MDSSGRPKADAQLTALVEAYASLIRRAVRRVSGSRAPLIQDDVQQNVMLALWQQLERGQTIERPASYIFRAAFARRFGSSGATTGTRQPRSMTTNGWWRRLPGAIRIDTSRTKSVSKR